MESGSPVQVMPPDIKEQTINIEEIFRAKNPRLFRWTPRFVVNGLKKLIQQDEINRIIYTYPNDNPVAFSHHILEEFRVKVDVIGIENLHKSHRFIIASNHPLGALDGVAMLDVVGQIFPDVIFPVNDILLFIPQFRQSFVPISKQGSDVSNTANLKSVQNYFATDSPILYFPAGLCSRKQHGKIEDLEWKKAFITLAVKYKRDIIPTFFHGRNSNFFYNLSNFRTKLGIKFNMELSLLPREMFRQQGNHFRVVFGTPIPYTFFDNRYKPGQWAHLLHDFVYTLKTGDESFEGFIIQKNA